ncbi:MAG: relaxase/mobilization nuclease domain-containing protein [Mobilitalea sp.]
MAISKILYIKDCGSSYNGKHLKQALDYITVKEKTGNGRFISGLNCQPEFAYEQMKKTKVKFGKVDQRQAYHMIISFEEGEVDAPDAFEIIGKFAKEYLVEGYEAVYAVHDNTDHIHGHILFNSVNFQSGMKYRYEKGDWAREIQPITNRLCQEYGLSTIEISEDRAKSAESYKEWNDFRDGNFVWSDMIKRDLDACILQAITFDSFLKLLSGKGYEIKQGGKYLAIKPQGMTRFKRCKTLGEEYSEERIKERIHMEILTPQRTDNKNGSPRISRCRVKRFKRAKLSKLQKKYYARLYRIGNLKKQPYSQAWKYRNEIRKMKNVQAQYLFLVRHDLRSLQEVATAEEYFSERKKEISKEKSRTFKARAKYQPMFAIADEMEELKECEHSYILGDIFFQAEYERYQILEKQLYKEGYSAEEIMALKEHYRNEIVAVREKEQAVAKEIRTAKSILSEIRKEQITGIKRDSYYEVSDEKEPIEKTIEKTSEETKEKTKNETKEETMEETKNETLEQEKQPRR